MYYIFFWNLFTCCLHWISSSTTQPWGALSAIAVTSIHLPASSSTAESQPAALLPHWSMRLIRWRRSANWDTSGFVHISPSLLHITTLWIHVENLHRRLSSWYIFFVWVYIEAGGPLISLLLMMFVFHNIRHLGWDLHQAVQTFHRIEQTEKARINLSVHSEFISVILLDSSDIKNLAAVSFKITQFFKTSKSTDLKTLMNKKKGIIR